MWNKELAHHSAARFIFSDGTAWSIRFFQFIAQSLLHFITDRHTMVLALGKPADAHGEDELKSRNYGFIG